MLWINPPPYCIRRRRTRKAIEVRRSEAISDGVTAGLIAQTRYPSTDERDGETLGGRTVVKQPDYDYDLLNLDVERHGGT